MRVDRIRLYPDHPKGEIKAARAGSFLKSGYSFDVIRPGYDDQGNRRIQWTQVVHKGIPVWAHKVDGVSLSEVIRQFEAKWKEHGLDEDVELVGRALAATCKARYDRFRDGETGVAPAQALTIDGRGRGEEYLR